MGLVSAHFTMSVDKLRRRVAWEAARLMYTREESEYFRAKLKAARRLASGGRTTCGRCGSRRCG